MTNEFTLEPPQDPGAAELPEHVSWPKTLAVYMDTLAATLMHEGVPAERASYLAERGTLALALMQGGGNVYLPTGSRLRTAARNRRIFLDWRGDNYAELRAKYRLGTTRRVQQIVAEQMAIHRRQVQPELFPPAAD